MTNKYYPADMVNTNYGLPEKAWNRLQDAYAKHLIEHPICESCCRRPSVRITPLGAIRASCLECIEATTKEMQESYERECAELEKEEAYYRRQQNEEF